MNRMDTRNESMMSGWRPGSVACCQTWFPLTGAGSESLCSLRWLCCVGGNLSSKKSGISDVPAFFYS